MTLEVPRHRPGHLARSRGRGPRAPRHPRCRWRPRSPRRGPGRATATGRGAGDLADRRVLIARRRARRRPPRPTATRGGWSPWRAPRSTGRGRRPDPDRQHTAATALPAPAHVGSAGRRPTGRVGPVGLLEGDAGVVGDRALPHVDDLRQPVHPGGRRRALEVDDEVLRELPQDAGDRLFGARPGRSTRFWWSPCAARRRAPRRQRRRHALLEGERLADRPRCACLQRALPHDSTSQETGEHPGHRHHVGGVVVHDEPRRARARCRRRARSLVGRTARRGGRRSARRSATPENTALTRRLGRGPPPTRSMTSRTAGAQLDLGVAQAERRRRPR